MRTDRILEMERYILQKGSATMEDLVGKFGVSMNTVRRDVVTLLNRGTVEKVYGGVCAKAAEQTLTPYHVRLMDGEDAKTRIAKKAAEMVRDGDAIFIDSGTTTLRIIDFLADKQNLTIVTNNLDAIMKANLHENMTVFVLPGRVRRKTNSITGDETGAYLQRYNIRLAFIAATGVSEHGVTNSSPLEYEIKKRAVEKSDTAVLVVTEEKFGVTGLMTFAALEQFDTVVTEAEPPKPYRDLIKKEGVNLILAEK